MAPLGRSPIASAVLVVVLAACLHSASAAHIYAGALPRPETRS